MVAGYDHTQSSPSTTWTITHSLGTTNVAIDAILSYNGSPATVEKVIPLHFIVVDANTIKVLFSAAQKGYARVVGGV